MKTVPKIIASLTAAALLAACAQTKDFARPDPNVLLIGKSSYADTVRLLGEPPYKPHHVTINNESIETVNYRYYHAAKFVGLVAPEKFLHLSFFNGVLVGEEFVSSFESDTTRFEPRNAFALIDGKSTRADVIKALGKPSGEIIYPLVRDRTGSGLVYWYEESRPAFVYISKSYRLIIFLDGKGLVTDMSYREDYGPEQIPSHRTVRPSDPLGAAFLSY